MKNSISHIKNYFDHLIDDGVKAFNLHDKNRYENNLRLAAKIIRDLGRNGQIDMALAIEPIWYNQLVKKVENEEHYYNAFQWHKDCLWQAGKKKSLEAPSIPAVRDFRKIIFIAHTGFYLGHIAVMVKIMKDWRTIFPHVQIFFVALNGVDQRLLNELAGIEVSVLEFPENVFKPTQKVEWIRKKNIELGVTTAVWLSTPCWVTYVFGYQVAARQVFWSLKFHSVYLGNSVTHIGMTKDSTGSVNINGNPWYAYQPPLAVDCRQVSSLEVQKIKDLLPDGFLFGTLAREEKFNSIEFVTSVIKILEDCPKSYFVYTGKINSPYLQTRLKEVGLIDRLVYVGWVDTNLYAKTLDVFLETFPFGCGVTGMQALSHGTRLISMWSEDTLPRFYFDNLEKAQKFSPNWTVAGNINEYIGAAVSVYKLESRQNMDLAMQNKIHELDQLKSTKFYELVYEN